MEAKKNPDKDISRKSGQFFLIGLSISVSLMITAFEWRTEIIKPPFEPRPFEEPTILTEIELPKIKLPKPPEENLVKPKSSTPSFTPVAIQDNPTDDDEHNEPIYESDSLAFTGPTDFISDVPEPDTTIYIFVQIAPKPVNGFNGFYQDLSEKIKYPSQARRMEIEGKVFVEFVISKKGEPADFKVVKGIGAGCDEEAMRVIAQSKWEPGKQRGIPVRVKMIMPVIFKLGQ